MTYRKLTRVAQGTAGEVFRATTLSGETYALKIGSPESARALADEALSVQRADSPCMPRLVDVGTGVLRDDTLEVVTRATDQARPFLALEWVDGPSLDPHSATAYEAAWVVARDVGDALADLHEAGRAHGDVKPDNILVVSERATLVDLSLATNAFASDPPRGGTPRYLALHDGKLGDARARDLLALGLVLAECIMPQARDADDPLSAARRTGGSDPLAAIVLALIAPSPGARPSARWVSEQARTMLGVDHSAMDRERRRLRASYLRSRHCELQMATTAHPDTADWAQDAVAQAARAQAMCSAFDNSAVKPSGHQLELAPLDVLGIQRWLTTAVGHAGSLWPLGAFEHHTERALAEKLGQLADQRAVRSWTFGDVQSALGGNATTATTPQPAIQTIDAASAASLAAALSRSPLDEISVATVERLADDAPKALVSQAVDMLRLAGQLGRARALIARRNLCNGVACDVLRRSDEQERVLGLLPNKRHWAGCPDRMLATIARVELDRGKPARALELVDHAHDAAGCEVAALAHYRLGDSNAALKALEHGAALARTAEARARIAATEAFVLHWSDPARARRGHRLAVEHAVRAGAVLEEATYRTGEAAACVDLGELANAIAGGTRATLLWEQVLDQPAMAARAWLAVAASYAAVDATHEAEAAANKASEAAEMGGDQRARAFALWVLADIYEPGAEQGLNAARRAAALTGKDAGSDDALYSAARLLRHQPDELDATTQKRLDTAATQSERDALCRIAWWGARAARLLDGSLDEARQRDAHAVVARLAALAEARAPIATLGRAMHAGARLAARIADTDAAARFETARARAASVIRAHAGDELAEAVRACSWIHRSVDATTATTIDLSGLLGALSERTSLRVLLDRVLDALLVWTGAERGLLLLTTPGRKLTPRAARGIGRGALGKEQIAVSTSLAQRALDSGETVVALDAIHELGDRYESVHALGLRSVLAVPLITGGERLGVVYLDDRIRSGAFGEKQIAWVRAAAPIAALAIADARTEVQLRRAINRAERSQKKLEALLAEKETALDVAERELAKTVRGRKTRFSYDGIVGESGAMQKLLRMVDRVCAADVPVLLYGESGSGKELIARALHRNSPRSKQAFVSENCGALPESLLESALFGHVKGAFTGAHRTRAGLFQAADDGTLFLDEVGEMSLGMQAKLLRVLEDGVVRPVGSERSQKVNVRILAATHRDLEKMVEEGSFRQDLFYRLNVVSLEVPALRERSSDVPLLVRHLIAKHAPEGTAVEVSRAALTALECHEWPGNVRQLENEVRRALLLSDGSIDVEHLSIAESSDDAKVNAGLNVRARIDLLEIDLVSEALGRTGGNQTQAAKVLGISRYGLHKMMKRLGIDAHRVH